MPEQTTRPAEGVAMVKSVNIKITDKCEVNWPQ